MTSDTQHCKRGDWVTIGIIIPIVALIVFLAQYYGWLSPDSQNYLALADNLSSRELLAVYPDWGQKYFAIFPAGYPIAIALFKAILGTNSLVASKILNGCLLLGSITISALLLGVPFIMTGTIFLSIPMLQILHFTWSENLFLFANVLSLFALNRYLENKRLSFLFLYAFALIILITSRYIGGILLLGYFLILAMEVKNNKSIFLWNSIFATLFAMVVFIGYLNINKLLTGYFTGIERPPASESFSELATVYIKAIIKSVLAIGFPVLILGSILCGKINVKLKILITDKKSRQFILIGLFYLVILFVLRSLRFFDSFDVRLVAPGLVMVLLGAIHPWCKKGQHNKTLAYVIFVCLFFLNIGFFYLHSIKNPSLFFKESVTRRIAKQQQRLRLVPNGAVIISLSDLRNNLTGSFSYNLPIGGNIFYILPGWLPYSSKNLCNASVESLHSFRARIASLRYKGKPPVKVFFDFSNIPNEASLLTVFNQIRFDSTIVSWIRNHFSAGNLIECYDCMK